MTLEQRLARLERRNRWLTIALALVLIIEGLLPGLAPSTWMKVMSDVAKMGPQGIRMAGIGGTGVVTVAQLLATAAMFDGWDVHGLDQTGLSQKAGPVVSDVRIRRDDVPATNHASAAGVDAILAFDLLVAASDACLESTTDNAGFIKSTALDLLNKPSRHLKISLQAGKNFCGVLLNRCIQLTNGLAFFHG